METKTSEEIEKEKYEKFLQEKNVIILLNKSDLDQKVTMEDVKIRLDKKIISISAKERLGITELEETIKKMFFHGEISFNDEIYAINVRQKNSLQLATEHLQQVLQSIQDGMPEDFFSIDLMSAYESLGRIIGESVGEDLVNEIFSKFCMGK